MGSRSNTVNKLIILFVFDKMESAISEETILEICTTSNNWMGYMDCINVLHKLLDNHFIYCINEDSLDQHPMYSITSDGRETLANFYISIPKSVREEISIYVKKNGTRLKNKSTCRSDFFQNKDGTYTVFLRILSPIQPILELKFVVPDKKTASNINKKWEEKAADFYSVVYDNLCD